MWGKIPPITHLKANGIPAREDFRYRLLVHSYFMYDLSTSAFLALNIGSIFFHRRVNSLIFEKKTELWNQDKIVLINISSNNSMSVPYQARM